MTKMERLLFSIKNSNKCFQVYKYLYLVFADKQLAQS